jgi:hypothetical protein
MQMGCAKIAPANDPAGAIFVLLTRQLKYQRSSFRRKPGTQ